MITAALFNYSAFLHRKSIKLLTNS